MQERLLTIFIRDATTYKSPMKTSAPNPNAKLAPQPVRFDPEDEKMIRDLAEETDLSIASIIRRACSYAVPLFLSGKVNILGVKKTAKGK